MTIQVTKIMELHTQNRNRKFTKLHCAKIFKCSVFLRLQTSYICPLFHAVIHRNNNPSITPTPDDNLLNSAHYKEWHRILRKSTRLRDSFFKFFIQFIMYIGETTSLIFTLITGIVLHTDNKEETLVAILLHVTTCAITVAVKYAR